MIDLSSLLDIFDPDTVHRLATDRVIRRGESYRNAGAVKITALTTTAITADVQGTHRYEVRFDVSEHPEWSCSCPAAVDGDFCKHCVAVALELAMIDAGATDPPLVLPADAQPTRALRRGTGDGDNSVVGRQGIVGYLEQLPTERLIELLIEQTDSDWKLRERLLLEADAGHRPVDLDRWVRRIDEAMFVDDYVDWRAADGWTNGVYFVLDAIDDLLTGGHDDEAIRLYLDDFEGAPSLRSLERYLNATSDDRDAHLDAAIEHVRGQVGSSCTSRPTVSNEVLVEILMWAGRDDDAWAAATTGGCSPSRRIDLAKRRESSHPIDAIDTFEPQIFRSIEAKNNQSYAAAVDLMARVERLAAAARVPERFDTIVHVARTTHKPKRNLQKLLGQRGW
ncbi:MAG: SWIM zinc finger family protein [Ilumatobacteraceae bacterium]